MDALELVLRTGLTATFLLSAAGKTMSFAASAEMISQLLGPRGRRLHRPAAAGLILGEGAAAVLVATAAPGARTDAAVVAVLVLCGLFAGAALRAALSGRRIACRCFGSLRPTQRLGPRTLLRAIPLVVAVLIWGQVMDRVSLSALGVSDRAGLSLSITALLSSGIAWTHWRRGIPHRRFTNEAIYRQLTQPTR